MDLDLPQQDKLYYNFIQGSKDAKKLFTSTIDFMNHLGIKGTKDCFEIMVALSKKLTDNAYFSEAKLLNQLAVSEFSQSYQLLEESARICFIFEDYKNSIEFQKKAIAARNSQGQVGGLLDNNWTNIGLSYYELQDYNESINAFQHALHLNPHCLGAMINMALV